jgi:hypothetical protein
VYDEFIRQFYVEIKKWMVVKIGIREKSFIIVYVEIKKWMVVKVEIREKPFIIENIIKYR